MKQQHMLIVEDDPLVRMMLELQLQQAGYATVAVESGEMALDLLSRERFELLLTDLRLPNMDGMQLIAKARALDPDIAVIIITGEATTDTAVAAINHQVHRYLIKPFHRDELVRSVTEALARRHALAERPYDYHVNHSGQSDDPIIQVGPLRIDPYRHRVTYRGRLLPLSNGELTLLMHLAQKRGIVVSAQEIAREVMHYNCTPQEARDLVRRRIHALRHKIEGGHGTPRLIESIRGAGYRLLEENELEDY
jgi:DNA-binding response OmpR family regulator